MRRAAVVLVGLLIALLGTGPAAAHAELTGFALDAAVQPHVVRLTFSEQVEALGLDLIVLDPNGNAVQDGEPVVDGASITVALQPFTVAGDYRVNFRVLSADGHVVTGSNTFSVSRAGLDVSSSPLPVLTASPETSAVLANDPSVAYWITGFLVLCGLIAVAAVWRIRR